jgi:hypothetical protein
MSQLVEVAVTKAPRALSCKSIEYYTPKEYIEAARQVMGSIDTDPASCELANRTVKAAKFYTKEDNGLSYPWLGNVWLNPPYGKEGSRANQARWSQKLIEQYQAGITKQAVLLVTGATETKWFQVLFDYPICFPGKRINFYTPDEDRGGATCASALVYIGTDNDRFYNVFHQFGRVVRAMPIPTTNTLWEEAS